jgi:hypothetical protein
MDWQGETAWDTKRRACTGRHSLLIDFPRSDPKYLLPYSLQPPAHRLMCLSTGAAFHWPCYQVYGALALLPSVWSTGLVTKCMQHWPCYQVYGALALLPSVWSTGLPQKLILSRPTHFTLFMGILVALSG